MITMTEYLEIVRKAAATADVIAGRMRDALKSGLSPYQASRWADKHGRIRIDNASRGTHDRMVTVMWQKVFEEEIAERKARIIQAARAARASNRSAA